MGNGLSKSMSVFTSREHSSKRDKKIGQLEEWLDTKFSCLITAEGITLTMLFLIPAHPKCIEEYIPHTYNLCQLAFLLLQPPLPAAKRPYDLVF